MKPRLVDADVFIRANREPNGLDCCPAFWDWLAFRGQAGAAGSVFAVLEGHRCPPDLMQVGAGVRQPAVP